MNQLPVFLNLSGCPVIVLGEGDAAEAKRRLIERAGGMVVGESDRNAKIAIVAIENEQAAIDAVERLKSRGLLVNAVDRAALCDFTMPAIIDRDPVVIAFGTGGASAGLAKALRQRFEQLLPSTLGDLAKKLFAARPTIASRWPEATERRRAIDLALLEGGVLDPLTQSSGDRVETWLNAKSQFMETGEFTLRVSSNDPDDLTLKQVRLLGAADTVYYDSRISQEVLNRIRADAVVRIWDREPVISCNNEITLILDFVPSENS